MRRVLRLVPFLLAGCSTAPVAGTMDTIDKHHRDRDRDRRDEPQPPPGFYEPASRRRPKDVDPPVDPPTAHADPYDMPAQPVRRPKSFEPKDKVRQTPATPATRTRDMSPDRDFDDDPPRTSDRGSSRPDRSRDRVLPPPPLPASDERDDF